MNDPTDRSWGLSEAARLFAQRCAQRSPEPVEEFLRQHRALREWLEPMLAESPLPEDSESLLGPAVLGPYRLLRELGKGGMGVVHEARRGEDPTAVALKILPEHMALRDDRVVRFVREAELARRLDHPGIVRVLDAGTVGATRFLAMEFVVGAPLDQVLRALRGCDPAKLTGADLECAVREALHVPQGQVPPPRSPEAFAGSYVACVVRLAIQLAAALDHAHSCGVIHRDVKPSNVLVRADGGLVLTDFGLARDREISTLTATGDLAGTPYYVSPEQAMAKRVPLDHRTDLFSLGSTLYEMLTMRRPFDGETMQVVLARILTKEPPRPVRFHAGLAEGLVAILCKLLEKDPDRRYRDAAELAAELRAFLEFRPVAARRASNLRRALRWTQREPLKAALVLVLAGSTLILAGGGGYLWARRDEIRAGREHLLARRVERAVDLAFLDFMLEVPDLGRRRFEEALELDPRCREAQIGLVVALLKHDGPGPTLERLDVELAPNMVRDVRDRLRYPLLDRLQRTEEARAIAVRLPEPSTELDWVIHAFMSRDQGENAGTDLLECIERAVLAAERPSLWVQLHWAVYADAARVATSCRRCAASLMVHWPSSPIARYFACIALRHVDPQRAEQLIEEGLAEDPQAGLMHCAAGMLRRVRGDLPGAIASFERAVEANPSISAFVYSLGSARFESGDSAGGIEALRTACDRSPRFVAAWIALGMVLRNAGRAPEGLEALRHAVELHPTHADAHFQLGQTLVMMHRLDEGLVELREAVRLQPKDPNKWHHFASALFATGDDEGGLAALHRAVQAMPSHERAHEMLAMYLRRTGDRAGERAAIDAWVEALPQSTKGWLELGRHCVSYDEPSAVWAAQRVLRITREESALAWFVLGDAQARLGRIENARGALERSLAARNSPLGDAERAACERLLNSLQQRSEGSSPR